MADLDGTGATDLPVAAGAMDGERLTDARAVHDRLRQAILRGDVTPDRPISQVRLAEQFGVSRTPLREALRMLEREGLVRSEPRRRISIAPLSPADCEEVYLQRIVLEPLAVRITVPELTTQELDELGQLLSEMDRLAEAEDFDRWEEVHHRFHDGLSRHAGERLATSVRQLADHAVRYRRAYLLTPRAWTVNRAEHRAIFDAAREGRAVQAAHEMARHLARTALTVVAELDPDREPRRLRVALRFATSSVEGNEE